MLIDSLWHLVERGLRFLTLSTPPSVSPHGSGIIYFDGNKFKVSEDGGGYVSLVGGASRNPPCTIVVDAAGGGDAATIQAGINLLPSTGGEVHIRAGYYALAAPLVIPGGKSVALIGDAPIEPDMTGDSADPLTAGDYPVIIDIGAGGFAALSNATISGYESYRFERLAFRSAGTSGSKLLESTASGNWGTYRFRECYAWGFETIIDAISYVGVRMENTTFLSTGLTTGTTWNGNSVAYHSLHMKNSSIGGGTSYNFGTFTGSDGLYIAMEESNLSVTGGGVTLSAISARLGAIILDKGAFVSFLGGASEINNSEIYTYGPAAMGLALGSAVIGTDMYGLYLDMGAEARLIGNTIDNACLVSVGNESVVENNFQAAAGQITTSSPPGDVIVNGVRSVKYTAIVGDSYSTVLDWGSDVGGLTGVIRVANTHLSNGITYQYTCTGIDGSTQVSSGNIAAGSFSLLSLATDLGSAHVPFAAVKVEVQNQVAGNNATVRVDTAVAGSRLP